MSICINDFSGKYLFKSVPHQKTGTVQDKIESVKGVPKKSLIKS
jgi:hypothetical protein